MYTYVFVLPGISVFTPGGFLESSCIVETVIDTIDYSGINVMYFFQGCPLTAGVGLPHFEPNEISCNWGQISKHWIHSGCLSSVNVACTAVCIQTCMCLRCYQLGSSSKDIINIIKRYSPQKACVFTVSSYQCGFLVVVIFFCIGNDAMTNSRQGWMPWRTVWCGKSMNYLATHLDSECVSTRHIKEAQKNEQNLYKYCIIYSEQLKKDNI